MRLIDADALKQIAQEHGFTFVDFQALDNAPTIDAVPVVRCQKCLFKMPPKKFGDLQCKLLDIPMKNDDFCSYGERKGGEG